MCVRACVCVCVRARMIFGYRSETTRFPHPSIVLLFRVLQTRTLPLRSYELGLFTDEVLYFSSKS